jgi:predicted O-methyltransferase YrrM
VELRSRGAEVVSIHDRIVELYGAKMLRKSAMGIRAGGGVFERVLSGKGYRTVLEIGTYRGCSTAEIAQYVDRVITIDLKHGRIEQSGEEFDRYAFWQSLGVNNVELRLVKDDAEKARIVNTLDFDLAFIDGAHDQTVANDFALTRRCGRVLFHDADDNRLREVKPNAPNCVFEFIDTLPKNEVEFMDGIFALWTKCGLT